MIHSEGLEGVPCSLLVLGYIRLKGYKINVELTWLGTEFHILCIT